ncbi:hypothetical protein GOODEAATRI_014055 [Goodea atripinnis]|uniref:Uncharacterized protein n=1 Tax=Goodea atripinnis TaxID=208336 RepID=A0ABV0P470_9TELE
MIWPCVYGRVDRGEGGALRVVEGVEAGVRVGRAATRRSRFMEIQFGDQRFAHRYWQPLLDLFIHVRICVMKADGKGEVPLQVAAQLQSLPPSCYRTATHVWKKLTAFYKRQIQIRFCLRVLHLAKT